MAKKDAKNNASQVTSYHAHVYYDAGTRRLAAGLRGKVKKGFKVELGRWHDTPVGPHPRPMYLIWFKARHFAAIVPWLAMNRNGLSILVHPQTEDLLADHTDHAIWLGKQIRLRVGRLGRRPRAKAGF